MDIVRFIRELLLAIKEAFTFLDNKQQLDAGKAIANNEATKEREERVKKARKIDSESANRTDDFRL